ncbi:MAG: hypothetical protein HY319_13295 [Armatimonadetes bacterium]|nr:hypothetical protein [Armatimonadota bacterium]
MSKASVYLLLTVVFVAVGIWGLVHGLNPGGKLRVDDLSFGSSRTGLQAENPEFEAGEMLWLTFKVRGCAADNLQNCNGVLDVKVEGPADFNLPRGQGPFQFRKNSDITHLDYNEKVRVPRDAATGEYKLIITVDDTVADKKVERTFDFSVKADPAMQNVDRRAYGQYLACQSNVKNVATGLEMWSTDNEGRYPGSLAQLVPDYLRAIPTCPSAGTDSYSPTYRSSTDPDVFTVLCQGAHHTDAGAPENYPEYSSVTGIKD